MLREIKNARQIEGEARRRWFFCHELDLVVWFDPSDAPMAFQLAYDKYANEHSISWHRDRGFRHYGVDDGEASGLSSQTPFLFAAGRFDRDRILAQFTNLSSELPPELSAFVSNRLQAFDSLAYA